MSFTVSVHEKFADKWGEEQVIVLPVEIRPGQGREGERRERKRGREAGRERNSILWDLFIKQIPSPVPETLPGAGVE